MHSESSHNSSQSITSHAHYINEHSQSFNEVHPKASNQQQFEKASSTNKEAHLVNNEKK